MMRKLLYIFLLFQVSQVFAQETKEPDFTALDSLYREDQFYFGFTYDILQHRPEGITQNKFSSGFTLGFLRDMPVNKARTWAIAAGLGYSINNFNQNLLISEIPDGYDYSVIDEELAYDKNKIIIHYVELPIEIRWRTSTPQSHKFWRVYTGLKCSYMVFNRYKFQDGDDRYSLSSIDDLSKFQYGAYIATGYNTWNLNVYYGFNPLFKSAKLNGEDIDMRTLNVGLMFYIL
jgi:hypothetical protein